MNSSRMQGAALSAFRKKALDRSADDFTVQQVIAIEKAAVELASGSRKIFAGSAAALIHFRARMSDTFHCTEEPYLDTVLDGSGFVEPN